MILIFLSHIPIVYLKLSPSQIKFLKLLLFLFGPTFLLTRKEQKKKIGSLFCIREINKKKLGYFLAYKKKCVTFFCKRNMSQQFFSRLTAELNFLFYKSYTRGRFRKSLYVPSLLSLKLSNCIVHFSSLKCRNIL